MRRRRQGQRGNAYMEMALVMLPLFAILFAITDFGFAIFLKNTFQHAVREGCRYAVTYQVMSGMGHDDSIKTVVKHASMGFLNSPDAAAHIHIRYYNPVTFAEVPENNPGNIIEVSVEDYSWGWMAPLLRSSTPINISARSSDRMEGLPGGSSPPVR